MRIEKVFQLAGGLCGAAVLRGLRYGTRDFAAACAWASRAVSRMESQPLRSIPQVPLGEILGDRKPVVRMPVQRYENGMMPSHEAIALLGILVAENPKAVLEIGTFCGHTTKAMAMCLPETTIHTLDLPPDFQPEPGEDPAIPKDDFHLIAGRTVGREFQGTEYGRNIRQHFGDSATWDFSQARGATFFFIDASHTYEHCLSDSEKCLQLCSGGETFLWHDCDEGHQGVVRMIDEWRQKGRKAVRIEGTSLAYWKHP